MSTETLQKITFFCAIITVVAGTLALFAGAMVLLYQRKVRGAVEAFNKAADDRLRRLEKFTGILKD